MCSLNVTCLIVVYIGPYVGFFCDGGDENKRMRYRHTDGRGPETRSGIPRDVTAASANGDDTETLLFSPQRSAGNSDTHTHTHTHQKIYFAMKQKNDADKKSTMSAGMNIISAVLVMGIVCAFAGYIWLNHVHSKRTEELLEETLARSQAFIEEMKAMDLGKVDLDMVQAFGELVRTIKEDLAEPTLPDVKERQRPADEDAAGDK
jgi:hypothetical protein